MILKVWRVDKGWTGHITLDDDIIIRMNGVERRLGCAVRNLLNSLEHRYGIDSQEVVLDLGEL